MAWSVFVGLCVDAYQILRRTNKLIISFAAMMMAPFQKSDGVRAFIAQRLRLGNKEEGAVLAKIRKKVENAPKRLKTKFKNKLHSIATSAAARKGDT